MRPFDAGAALVRVDDIADHHDHRRAIAEGVVHRHRGMLQTDRAVAQHRQRHAFHLGVAMRHRRGDFFMHASDHFGLGVAAVIDQRFVQAAIARGRRHGDVFEIQRLHDIDHEVAAARGLLDRIGIRRQRLGQRDPGRGTCRAGGGINPATAGMAAAALTGVATGRGARQGCAFQKIATPDIRFTAAFCHASLPLPPAESASIRDFLREVSRRAGGESTGRRR